MRISDIISIGSRYLILGGILAIIVILIILLINRLAFKGKKKLKKTKLIWWVLFICYVVVVLGATLMERGNFWINTTIMPLFYSYKQAWVSGLAVDWRNIILNICMFMPLGFLLPLGCKIFKSFWITAFTGFLLTAIIEGSQLYFQLGMFELDDLMNNTVGTMIGFGFYMLYARIILQKDVPKRRILISQIPFLVTLLVFGSLFTLYHMHELGNLSYACIIPLKTENLSVSSDIILSEESGSAVVYKCQTLTKEEATKFADNFFENLGTSLDESQNDFYDETAVFYDENRRYNLWINYLGGSYRFTDFNSTFDEQLLFKADATETEVKDALKHFGIFIPDDVTMTCLEDMESYAFEYIQYKTNSCFLDGSLMVEYMGDGSIAGFNNSVIICDFYKEFPMISEKEAYEMICDGKFNYQLVDDLEIRVKSCALAYVTDSKDFYQPVYQFICEINGNESVIGIPAIKNIKIKK